MKKGVLNYTFSVAPVLLLVGCYVWVLTVAGGGLTDLAIPYLLALAAGVSTLWSP